MEIHQKISMPDYQKLKTSDYEILTPGMRVQWLRVAGVKKVLDKEFAIIGKQKGSVREETSVVSGTTEMSVQNRHQKPLHPLSHQHKEVDVHRGKRTSEAGAHQGSSLDSRAEITWKVFAPHHLVTNGILLNVNSISLNRVVDSAISARLHKGTLRENPVKSRRRMVTTMLKDLLQLCWFQDTEPPESLSILQKRTKVCGPIRRVRFTKATQRHPNIRGNKGRSLGKFKVKAPHQRSPYAMKFEDRSQEEIERQERCARGDAWRMAKNILELKETDKATFFSPTTEWCLPAPSVIKLWEREFVVDSGPSVHMLSGKDLNSAEWETVRVSRSPTTVVTANGEVPTKEEATVYVKELDLFVRVKLLDDTPAVLSLRKLCQDLGYSYEWTTGQKPQLARNHYSSKMADG